MKGLDEIYHLRGGRGPYGMEIDEKSGPKVRKKKQKNNQKIYSIYTHISPFEGLIGGRRNSGVSQLNPPHPSGVFRL